MSVVIFIFLVIECNNFIVFDSRDAIEQDVLSSFVIVLTSVYKSGVGVRVGIAANNGGLRDFLVFRRVRMRLDVSVLRSEFASTGRGRWLGGSY